MSHLPPPEDYSHIIIENVSPEIDAGRYPVKRIVGDALAVSADIFMDSHDRLDAALCIRGPRASGWREIPMNPLGNDRWSATLPLKENGLYEYTLKAWPDWFGTWRSDTHAKRESGADISLELEEGRALIEKLLGKNTVSGNPRLSPGNPECAPYMLGENFYSLIKERARRIGEIEYGRTLKVICDRKLALFGAWYELFPRSQGNDPARSGTFSDCEARLPDIRSMGFDVVYLTPIHPIGVTHRKGRNNALIAGEGDPGSPYAIGGKEGGHKAIHPELGTLEDFRRFVEKTRALGMEVALDFALQVSRDHPYIAEHPEWFSFRPDGSIRFAENPPKKYEDIVNFNFGGGAELWEELYSIVRFWVEQGVTIFRVDNPHTKPFAFWEWLIGEIQRERPDILFLSEAFTRPRPMYLLAKLGFTQSYTYFTWRHAKAEFIQYMQELTGPDVVEFFRPNFFPSTPDILPEYLQKGGRPAFLIRLALAATLASSYGMLAGYELLEGAGIEGKEEYLDSEKYQIKPRNWNAEDNIKEFVRTLNRLRNENPALQDFRNTVFYPSSSDHILFFGKSCPARKNIIFVAVNLDCLAAHDAIIEMPLAALGINDNTPYMLDDLLLGHSWSWTGIRQYMHLDPARNPVSIFRITLP